MVKTDGDVVKGSLMAPKIFEELTPEMSQAYVEYLQLELKLCRLVADNAGLRDLLEQRRQPPAASAQSITSAVARTSFWHHEPHANPNGLPEPLR